MKIILSDDDLKRLFSNEDIFTEWVEQIRFAAKALGIESIKIEHKQEDKSSEHHIVNSVTDECSHCSHYNMRALKCMIHHNHVTPDSICKYFER